MEPKIESKATFTVVGLNYFGNNEKNELPALWDRLLPRVKEIQGLAQPHRSYGVCGSVDADGRFRYVAGFEVATANGLPDGMASWEVPEQTYAVFPCTLDTIAETYNYAFQTWLPAAGYTHIDAPDFEYYPPDFEPGQEMYIYVPVQAK